MILVILLTLFAIVLESSVISLTLTLSVLITLSFIYKKEWFLVLTLISGVFLDALAIRTVGVSSFFLLLTIFLIYIYEKKIEASVQMIFITNFVVAFLYTFLVKANFSIIEPFLASLFGVMLFIIFNKLEIVSFSKQKLGFEI